MKTIGRLGFGDNDTVLDGNSAGAWGFVHTPAAPADAFPGTPGDDTLNGTDSDDTFDLSAGGNDQANGNGGNDTFLMGAALTAADRIDGGLGTDTVVLSGNYGLKLQAATLTNIENIQLAGGFTYHLNASDADVASGHSLTVDASELSGSSHLDFTGGAAGSASLTVIGGAGNDVISVEGPGSVNVDVSQGGNDTVTAASSGGVINFGATFRATDQVSGVDLHSIVILQGDYSAGVTLTASTLAHIGTLDLLSGSSSGHTFAYALTMDDANLSAGSAMNVAGSALGTGEFLHFDGSAETDGDYEVFGGGGNDVLTGGAGNDLFRGNGGDDIIDGGAGKNRATFSNDPAGVTVTLLNQGHAQNTGDGNDTLNHIQDLSGGAGNDTLTGDGGANWLWGEGGNDTITGGNGNDVIQTGGLAGTDGVDVADGGGGVDTISFDDNGILDFSDPGAVFSLALQGTQQNTGRDLITATNFENLSGTGGHDILTGNAANNIIYGGGGEDSLFGGDGNDTLYGDKAYKGGNTSLGANGSTQAVDSPNGGYDVLTGGAGNDILDGGWGLNTASYADATSGVTVDLTKTGAQNVGGGDGKDTLINIQNLIGSNFDDVLIGGLEDNDMHGGAGNDTFHAGGGNNDIWGDDGNDTVYFFGSSGVDFSGGDGIDTLDAHLASSGLTYGLDSDVERFIGSGFGDTVMAADPSSTLARNFKGEDGNDTLTGGAGNDRLDGGSGDDVINISAGGNDVVLGGDGDETIKAGAALTSADRIDAGAGLSDIELNGDYSAGLTLGAFTLVNVGTIEMLAGHSYKITTNDATVAGAGFMLIDAKRLGASDMLNFNGSHETTGHFTIWGGAGNDIVAGGNGLSEEIVGFGGADKMTGGSGTDYFQYNAVSDSTGLGHDLITGFDTSNDRLQFNFHVTGVDGTIGSGTLRGGGHFDTDLAAAVGSGQLAANHAVMFNPDAGNYAGHTYLIVDANGVAGYQPGADYVIELSGTVAIDSLGTNNFSLIPH